MKAAALFFLGITISFACTSIPYDPHQAFTSSELQPRGVILAPVAQEDSLSVKADAVTLSDLAAFDRVFSESLKASWQGKGIPVTSSDKLLQKMEADELEHWRKMLAAGESLAAIDYASLKNLSSDSRGALLVSARLLTDKASCGERAPIPGYFQKNPTANPYCQRVIKMHFQIYDAYRKELVWNALIYATDEDVSAPTPQPPSLERLLRQAFKNFAQVLAGDLKNLI